MNLYEILLSTTTSRRAKDIAAIGILREYSRSVVMGLANAWLDWEVHTALDYLDFEDKRREDRLQGANETGS